MTPITDSGTPVRSNDLSDLSDDPCSDLVTPGIDLVTPVRSTDPCYWPCDPWEAPGIIISTSRLSGAYLSALLLRLMRDGIYSSPRLLEATPITYSSSDPGLGPVSQRSLRRHFRRISPWESADLARPPRFLSRHSRLSLRSHLSDNSRLYNINTFKLGQVSHWASHSFKNHNIT